MDDNKLIVEVTKTDFEALKRWRTYAFTKYLLSQSRQDAVEHFLHCMSQGPSDAMVWDMLTEIYGEWRVSPGLMPSFINQTLDALEFATGGTMEEEP